MKTFLIAGTLILAAVAAFLSCNSKESPITSPASEEIQVKVDSVNFVKNVGSDSLSILFWARIGNSNCYSFSRYSATRDSFQIQIRVYGFYTPLSNCGPANVSLTGATYSVRPVYAGLFKVIILQPDGTMLRDSTFIIR